MIGAGRRGFLMMLSCYFMFFCRCWRRYWRWLRGPKIGFTLSNILLNYLEYPGEIICDTLNKNVCRGSPLLPLRIPRGDNITLHELGKKEILQDFTARDCMHSLCSSRERERGITTSFIFLLSVWKCLTFFLGAMLFGMKCLARRGKW